MSNTISDAQILRRAERRFTSSGRPPLSVAYPGIGQRSWHSVSTTLSVLGVGCARAGSIRNHTPVSEIRRMLASALDQGVNLIDTADIYGQGDSERIVGSVVKGRREDAFLVTKVGSQFRGQSPLLRVLKPGLRLASRYSPAFDALLERRRNSVMMQDFNPASLMVALEGSLRRLGVNEIDGLMLHSPPCGVLRDERTQAFLHKAKSQGKIRHFGASVESEIEARAALGMEGLELLQVDVDTARILGAGPEAREMESRSIALIVRQVLASSHPNGAMPRTTIEQALPAALAIPNVTSAVVGLSSRAHLQAAIDAIT